MQPKPAPQRGAAELSRSDTQSSAEELAQAGVSKREGRTNADGGEPRMSDAPALGFRPLYRQVRDVLVKRIADGVWQTGQILPSEPEIAQDLGVSAGTVRKALDEMTAENLVVRRQGRGTFVARHDDTRILFQFFKLTPDSGGRE